MTATLLRAATRGSQLALVQTALVADLLTARHPGLRVEAVTIKTTGDIHQRESVTQLGIGAFVRGVEAALLDGRADIAVHSAKDIPPAETPDLTLAAFPGRADPRDALVSRDGRPFAALPPGARLGTSSPRRAAIARSLRPDLDVREVRGNVDSRLGKLQAGEYDALILAAAGLLRLERADVVAEFLDPLVWVPAAGQGIMAVQTRAGDAAEPVVAAIDDAATRAAISAERAALARLNSGCSTPIGVYAWSDQGGLSARGVLVSPDGRRTVIADAHGPLPDAARIGSDLADDLLRRNQG